MGSFLSLAALAFLTSIAFMPWQSGSTALMGGVVTGRRVALLGLAPSPVDPGVAGLFCGLTADIVSGGPFGFWCMSIRSCHG